VFSLSFVRSATVQINLEARVAVPGVIFTGILGYSAAVSETPSPTPNHPPIHGSHPTCLLRTSPALSGHRSVSFPSSRAARNATRHPGLGVQRGKGKEELQETTTRNGHVLPRQDRGARAQGCSPALKGPLLQDPWPPRNETQGPVQNRETARLASRPHAAF
jgi:hypothetical protein